MPVYPGALRVAATGFRRCGAPLRDGPQTLFGYTTLASISAKNALKRATKADSAGLISSPIFSFTTDFSGLYLIPGSPRRWYRVHQGGNQGQFSMSEAGRTAVRRSFLLESVYKGGRRLAMVLAKHPFYPVLQIRLI